MTPERFRQIETLARAALEQSTAERTTFLDAACDDPKLRSEVDRLLESYGQIESFLEMPAFAGVADVAGVTADPESGRPADRQIGPYEVIREIGQGGMGTVYLAARRDDEYHRRVAIKLLRPGMNTAVVVRRFRSERQILSNLDHPHIARLFEGGTTRDGRPYFVMEYIDGVPLDAFCDRRLLPIRERLLLFLKVCSAVQYAHQNLVVHRDIKPSNILVTEAGEPKLLDFGIAKVLDPEAFPLTVEVTEPGLRPMTPHYASPEQIAGAPITTASDVYSLGVLLYKLLTGRSPYRLTGGSPLEAERELRNEPLKPSTALGESPAGKDGDSSEGLAVSRHRGTSPVGLHRQLVGDLDNIVLMALRREPQRRYSSAEKLSEDVRRHLDGLPVVACRDHFGYRLGKFLRRHKLAVVAATTVLALIVGSAITLAFQAAPCATLLAACTTVSAWTIRRGRCSMKRCGYGWRPTAPTTSMSRAAFTTWPRRSTSRPMGSGHNSWNGRSRCGGRLSERIIRWSPKASRCCPSSSRRMGTRRNPSRRSNAPSRFSSSSRGRRRRAWRKPT